MDCGAAIPLRLKQSVSEGALSILRERAAHKPQGDPEIYQMQKALCPGGHISSKDCSLLQRGDSLACQVLCKSCRELHGFSFLKPSFMLG